MKKLFSLILAVTMIFSAIGFAFASPVTKVSKKDFSADTVITQDNVNEILKYYGLDPTKIDKSKDVSTLSQVTVGDLEKALEEAKKTPKTVVVRDGAVTEKTNNDVSAAAVIVTTGTATVYKDSTITTSLVVNYSATGKYYKAVSNYDTVKYWTSALGSSISTSSETADYYWQITSIRKNANKVVNANTSSSYLQQDYDFTVTCYFGIRGIGGIPYKAINVSGYNRYPGSSYIP